MNGVAPCRESASAHEMIEALRRLHEQCTSCAANETQSGILANRCAKELLLLNFLNMLASPQHLRNLCMSINFLRFSALFLLLAGAFISALLIIGASRGRKAS